MIKTNYTQEFKEQAIQKTLQRGDKTIQCIADELNMSYHTLKNWLKSEPIKTMENSTTEKRPDDWTLAERLQCLLDSHTLEGDELNAFCRERGLFVHHLESWQKAFITPPKPPLDAPSKQAVKQLKKELNRKEKALAEAAALLVLQKKFNAFWEEKEQ
jgi:transposase-like protein